MTTVGSDLNGYTKGMIVKQANNKGIKLFWKHVVFIDKKFLLPGT